MKLQNHGLDRQRIKRSRHLCLMVVLLASLCSACGYRVASKNRLASSYKTLTVTPLQNQTTTFEVEQILTRALVKSFVEKTAFKVVDEKDSPDLLLKGRVVNVYATPVIFGRETDSNPRANNSGFGSTFLVTLNAAIEIQEKSSGKVVFRNNNYVFREQYEINIDPRNFFSELNPALDRIATDFAASVVTTVLEGF